MSRSSRWSCATRSAGKRGRLAAMALAAGALAVLVAVVASAGAATSSRTTIVLGSTATTPDPSCPEMPCQAIGSVTGFQVNNGQASLPFVVPRNGKVTAQRTLTLSQPTGQQRSFFNGFFEPHRRRAWRFCAASPAPIRPATTCAARARSACSAPTCARPSSSARR